MIDTLLSIVKPIDAPGSIPFLLLALAVGLVLRFGWRRTRTIGRNWLVGVVTGYGVLALPIVANGIAGGLAGARLTAAPDLGPLDALVVFDGDNRRGRVRTASELFARSHPHVVWVLGGEPEWLRDELPAGGVPPAMISMDQSTKNTRDQVNWVARYRTSDPQSRFAIIVSRLQVARVAGLVARLAPPIPLVGAPIDDEPPTRGPALFVPTYIALRVSRDALYEHAALAYYRSRGWIAR